MLLFLKVDLVRTVLPTAADSSAPIPIQTQRLVLGLFAFHAIGDLDGTFLPFAWLSRYVVPNIRA